MLRQGWNRSSLGQGSLGWMGIPARRHLLPHGAGLAQRTVLTPPVLGQEPRASRELQGFLQPLEKPEAGDAAHMGDASLLGSEPPGSCPGDVLAKLGAGQVPQDSNSIHAVVSQCCGQLLPGLLAQQNLQSTTRMAPAAAGCHRIYRGPTAGDSQTIAGRGEQSVGVTVLPGAAPKGAPTTGSVGYGVRPP